MVVPHLHATLWHGQHLGQTNAILSGATEACVPSRSWRWRYGVRYGAFNTLGERVTHREVVLTRLNLSL